MSVQIGDYALIGDTQTAALVGRDGSVDWLCFPRFDSPACFCALLGDSSHGRWLLCPQQREMYAVRRKYREGTLVLETVFTNAEGSVKVVDCMPLRGRAAEVVRVVEGLEGCVQMQMELAVRFDYGAGLPWLRRNADGRISAVAGPEALTLASPVEPEMCDSTVCARFEVRAGQSIPFMLTWYPSWEAEPARVDPLTMVAETEQWWRAWSARCHYEGPWRDAVVSSLVTLKALTFAPTGGIVAAPTTSLPERPGGVRNWDYRYCWLRDAAFTLDALMLGGHEAEAAAWRDWLLRAASGDPRKLQIMYGLAGERRLPEQVLDWLPGHAGAAPVRIGNAAATQLQLDVYGEAMDALYQARLVGLGPDADAWSLQAALLDFLEGSWQLPDRGLWEMRGAPRHFTHSKVMAWVAFDRAIKTCQTWGRSGPIERWRKVRDCIKQEVCASAWSSRQNAFAQAYGSDALDASALLMPQVGFLRPQDPRILSTVSAIERELMRDGFVWRYRSEQCADGLPPGEGAFLACTFWLADYYAMAERWQDALRLFQSLLSIRNDVGLLSEEFDPTTGQLLGNFPQAFSHVGLVNTAFHLQRLPGAQPASSEGG